MSTGELTRVAERYALPEDEAPSTGVYSLVAAVEGCSPLELAPLAETTDPDALDAFLANAAERAEVSFEYCGYEVTATPAEVSVQEAAGP